MLALATTTVTITRVNTLELDPYDQQPAPSVIASGVRAVISQERGSNIQQGSQQQTVTWRLDADPCDLQVGDIITDETSTLTYNTDWARLRAGLGLDHVEAGLRQVSARNPSLA